MQERNLPFLQLGCVPDILWPRQKNIIMEKKRLRVSTRDPLNRCKDRRSLSRNFSWWEISLFLFAFLDFSPYIYASFLSWAQVCLCATSCSCYYYSHHYFSHLLKMLLLKWMQRWIPPPPPSRILNLAALDVCTKLCWFFILPKQHSHFKHNNLQFSIVSRY